VLEAGRKQDYTGFYEHEIEARRQLQLPPTKRLIMIHIRGPQELQAEQVGEQFRQYIGKPLVGTATVSPVYPSAVARLRNQYRFEMMIITDRVVQTSRFLRQALRAYPTPTGVVLQVDVDA